MASDRDAAKDAVVKKQDDDPELDNALANAAHLQLELKKEDNRHEEKMHAQRLGFLGNWVGDGSHLPTTAALVTVVLAFLLAIGLFWAAFAQPGSGALWSTNAERSLSVAVAALAYVFGKGNR